MEELKCVIKTLKDENDTVVWEALYIDGKKQLEDIEINKEAANKLFNKNNNYKNFIIKEKYINEESIKNHFPVNETFIDLLDYKNIEIGTKIFLFDGQYEIESINEEYRISNYYDVVVWTEIDNKYYYNIDKTFYVGHNALKLKLKGFNEEVFWEDYNYQQSYLYLYLKQNDFFKKKRK